MRRVLFRGDVSAYLGLVFSFFLSTAQSVVVSVSPSVDLLHGENGYHGDACLPSAPKGKRFGASHPEPCRRQDENLRLLKNLDKVSLSNNVAVASIMPSETQ